MNGRDILGTIGCTAGVLYLVRACARLAWLFVFAPDTSLDLRVIAVYKARCPVCNTSVKSPVHSQNTYHTPEPSDISPIGRSPNSIVPNPGPNDLWLGDSGSFHPTHPQVVRKARQYEPRASLVKPKRAKMKNTCTGVVQFPQ